MIAALNTALAAVTVMGQAVLVVGVIYVIAVRNDPVNPVLRLLARHGIFLGWLVACAGLALSLVYSEVAGYEPCDLCWLQRIALYPQVVLLGLAWWRHEDVIIDYSLILVLIGTAIAAYHTYIGYGGTPLISCSATELENPCAKRYVFEFGYVTLPLMSLTAFLLLLAVLSLRKTLHHQGRQV